MSTLRERRELAEASSKAPVFSAALLAALRRPAAWGTCVLGVTGMALLAGLPVYRFINDTLEHRYAPGSQLHHLSQDFWSDKASGLELLISYLATSAGWLALAAWLFGIFTAGGWLRLLVDPGRGYGRLFFAGGARYFWRFFRLAIVVLILLHFCGVAFQGALWKKLVLEGWAGWADGSSTASHSELTFRRISWAGDGLYATSAALVLAWAMLTRTRMALQNGRSCLVAGAASLWLLMRHPLATLRPLMLLTLIEFAALLGLGFCMAGLQKALQSGNGLWLAPIFLVTSLSLILREILHGARYAASLRVSKRLVRPLAPDPWQDRIGGPGGPQYPLHDTDEFSVAM